MTMTITFTGSAAELREEMLTLLGVNTPKIDITHLIKERGLLAEEAEAPAAEEKKTRGRPRKAEAETPKEEKPVPSPQPEVVPAPQPEVEAVEPEPVAEEPAVEPEPEPVAEPVVEEPSNVPANATDMMSAVMEMVKGDSGKKIALVKLLAEYGAKTINTLDVANYPAFWAKVQTL